MPRFRCYACGQPPRYHEWEADDLIAPCPRCGQVDTPIIQPLTDIHFIVMDPAGVIQGARGRQYVACMPDRPHLGRNPFDDFAASDVASAVTCPRCRSTKGWQEHAKFFPELQMEMARERYRRGVTVDLGKKCKGC